MVLAAVIMTAGACATPGSDEVVTYGNAEEPVESAGPAPADGPDDAEAPPQRPPVVPAEEGGGEPESVTSVPSTSPTTARPRPASFAASADGGAGHLARVYLRPEPARQLVVEVLQQSGAAPQSGTVDHFATTLREVTRKRVQDGGRWLIEDERRSWTADDINGAVEALSHTRHESDTAVVHILFLRGSFERDPQVLGVATRADTVAVFPDRVDDASTALVGRGQIEAAVAVHELGHILGLVDLVVDTGRDDPEHPGHSRNRQSVMYWAVESGLVAQVLSGGPPTTFDEDDLADLAAMRNGA